LLTIKAKACIENADVVVYDYLANRVFLDYAGKKAELIYVGKKGGCHTMSQQDINRLIVDKANKGHNVARLKGGDPFIFGRGGEEAQELIKAGVTFEVVPGITSAIAVPAYAGIPLTHRDHTSTVAFITGHEDPTKEKSDIAWDKLATGAGTLVFLMGVGNLPKISERLMEYGRSPETPIAIIHRGTVSAQKTLVGCLGDIVQRLENETVKPPSIIVVGDVVNLRKDLNWFEERPLFGKKIVVTRARAQASGFLAQLSDLGAECIEFPTIEIIPPSTWDDMDQGIQSLDNYQWLLFTSVNGVEFFFERLVTLGKDVRDLKGILIGAIGPKTAQAIRDKGIRPELVPDEYRAEAVVEAFQKHDQKGVRVLLPQPLWGEVLPQELEKMGAVVDVVEAYRTVKPDGEKDRLVEMFEKGEIQMVTFTSSSTVSNFMEMFDAQGGQLQGRMGDVAVACIGPITAKTAEEKGLVVSLVPAEYTIEALTEEIVKFYTPLS
jgi:uroporphyrinogen III methyltransferase/synthase